MTGVPRHVSIIDDSRLADAVVRSLMEAGWTVRDGLEFDGDQWSTRSRVVCAGLVRNARDAQASVLACSRGADLVLELDPELDPATAAQLLDDLSRVASVEMRSLADDPTAQLSAEEQELLHLVGEGVPLAEVSRRLFLSRRSLDRRLVRIREKLGVRTTAEAIDLVATLSTQVSASRTPAGQREGKLDG